MRTIALCLFLFLVGTVVNQEITKRRVTDLQKHLLTVQQCLIDVQEACLTQQRVIKDQATNIDLLVTMNEHVVTQIVEITANERWLVTNQITTFALIDRLTTNPPRTTLVLTNSIGSVLDELIQRGLLETEERRTPEPRQGGRTL